MPRRPNIRRPVALKLMLPEDIRAKLDLVLYSEIEGRVPLGAYQRFFMERIHEFFKSEASLREIKDFLKAIDSTGLLVARARTLTEARETLHWIKSNVHLDSQSRERLDFMLSKED